MPKTSGRGEGAGGALASSNSIRRDDGAVAECGGAAEVGGERTVLKFETVGSSSSELGQSSSSEKTGSEWP